MIDLCYEYEFYIESTLYKFHKISSFWSKCCISGLCDSNGIRTHNHLVYKPTFDRSAQLAKFQNCVVSTRLYDASNRMLVACQVWDSSVNVKEFLDWSRRHIRGLSDSNGTWNHNYLVIKRTLNHIAILIGLFCE